MKLLIPPTLGLRRRTGAAVHIGDTAGIRQTRPRGIKKTKKLPATMPKSLENCDRRIPEDTGGCTLCFQLARV